MLHASRFSSSVIRACALLASLASSPSIILAHYFGCDVPADLTLGYGADRVEFVQTKLTVRLKSDSITLSENDDGDLTLSATERYGDIEGNPVTIYFEGQPRMAEQNGTEFGRSERIFETYRGAVFGMMAHNETLSRSTSQNSMDSIDPAASEYCRISLLLAKSERSETSESYATPLRPYELAKTVRELAERCLQLEICPEIHLMRTEKGTKSLRRSKRGFISYFVSPLLRTFVKLLYFDNGCTEIDLPEFKNTIKQNIWPFGNINLYLAMFHGKLKIRMSVVNLNEKDYGAYFYWGMVYQLDVDVTIHELTVEYPNVKLIYRNETATGRVAFTLTDLGMIFSLWANFRPSVACLDLHKFDIRNPGHINFTMPNLHKILPKKMLGNLAKQMMKLWSTFVHILQRKWSNYLRTFLQEIKIESLRSYLI